MIRALELAPLALLAYYVWASRRYTAPARRRSLDEEWARCPWNPERSRRDGVPRS